MEPAEKAEELTAGRQNLRAVPRFEVDAEAQLLLVEHGATLPCRIADLSLSGCRLLTRDRFPAKAMIRVEVTFKVRGLAFRFCGITQWTDGRNQVGIRFVDVSTRRKEEFLEAIAEVETENAAKQAAENEAAAMRAAEEQAAAELAAGQASSPPILEQDESPAQPLILVPAIPQTAEAQLLPKPGSLYVVPKAGGPQGPPASEANLTGSKGPSARLPKRERREQLREGVDTSAVIYLIHVASRLTGRILDLSLGGCRIRTDERFPVGIYTRVETEFRLEGLPFRLGGVIQAIHDRHSVGIRFLDMSSRKREQVEQLIAEIEELKRTGNRE